MQKKCKYSCKDPVQYKDVYSHYFYSVQFSPVAQPCPTLCNTMDCSMPGFPLHHQLLELPQTHVIRVSDVIQPSHPLWWQRSSHQSFPASGSFWVNQFFSSGGQSIGVSALASSFQWIFRTISFRMDWLDLLAVQGTQESSPTAQCKSISSSVLSFLYSPTLTSINEYWKNHSFD